VFHATRPCAQNAAAFSTQGTVDLDMLIALIRHIDAKRQIVSNYQVGVHLLRGLEFSLMFPILSHMAVFSPVLLRAITERDEQVMQYYGRIYRYRVCAANRGLSLQEEVTEAVLWQTIDDLEAGAGDIINNYATEAGVHLLPYDRI
jgi:hypothetical protein